MCVMSARQPGPSDAVVDAVDVVGAVTVTLFRFYSVLIRTKSYTLYAIERTSYIITVRAVAWRRITILPRQMKMPLRCCDNV